MNYDAELRLTCDTLRRYGLTVTFADPQNPVIKYLPPEMRPFWPAEIDSTISLAQCLPPIQADTVYLLRDRFQCCYLYFLLPDFGQEAMVVIGPYLSQPLPQSRILELAESLHMDPMELKSYQRFYEALPQFPDNSPLQMLLDTFFERLWGKDGYCIETLDQNSLYDPALLHPVTQLSEQERFLWNMDMLEKRYARENELLEAVRLGQLQRIEGFLARIPESAVEQRHPDPVRNLKNYCIITNTLLRKAAQQGGVHPVYLDQISSDYALKIEQMSSPSEGYPMIAEIAKGYCRLVRNHATAGYSSAVQKAILMIDAGLAEDLSLQRLSRSLNMGSSYFSSLFKKETGKTLTEYVTAQRMQQAKHLLETTKLQIQTIAQLCGILDVHYFSKLFKATTGLSPNAYRQSIKR